MTTLVGPSPRPLLEIPVPRQPNGQEAFLYNKGNVHELSGIPNRKAVDEALEHATQDKTLAGNFGILFVDLNGLKAINDELGHLEGDEYLKNAANVLRESLRDQDLTADHRYSPDAQLEKTDKTDDHEMFAAHLGGDEFVVLIAGVHEHEDLMKIANRLHDNLDELGTPNAIGGQIHKPGMSKEELLEAADKAMYENKMQQILENLTLKQKKAATKIARIALKANMRLRDIPGIIAALANQTDETDPINTSGGA